MSSKKKAKPVEPAAPPEPVIEGRKRKCPHCDSGRIKIAEHCDRGLVYRCLTCDQKSVWNSTERRMEKKGKG